LPIILTISSFILYPYLSLRLYLLLFASIFVLSLYKLFLVFCLSASTVHNVYAFLCVCYHPSISNFFTTS
jgi:hypothetical protein